MAKLDAQFFRPFVEGTLKTLQLQCGVAAKVGKPFIKGTQQQQTCDLAGVIGITSEAFTGSIILCFPAPIFLKIMNSMLNEKFTEITKDIENGAAELLNIIFGSAKIVLNEQGYKIQKAIPTVIRGNSMTTSHIGTEPVMVLPFHIDGGDFHVEIMLEGRSMA